MDLPIQHDEVARRFSVEVDGHPCEVDYRFADGVMSITHTGVPSAVGGRGIAATLTKFALDTARARNWKVVPSCTYADSYVRKHPEYQDLLA